MYRIVLSVSGAVARQHLVERVRELVLSAEGTPFTPVEADRVHVEVREDRGGFLDAGGEVMRVDSLPACTAPPAARASLPPLPSGQSGHSGPSSRSR